MEGNTVLNFAGLFELLEALYRLGVLFAIPISMVLFWIALNRLRIHAASGFNPGGGVTASNTVFIFIAGILFARIGLSFEGFQSVLLSDTSSNPFSTAYQYNDSWGQEKAVLKLVQAMLVTMGYFVFCRALFAMSTIGNPGSHQPGHIGPVGRTVGLLLASIALVRHVDLALAIDQYIAINPFAFLIPDSYQFN